MTKYRRENNLSNEEKTLQNKAEPTNELLESFTAMKSML